MSKNMSTAAAQTAPRHGLQNVRTLVSCALLAAVSVVLARFIIPMPNETTRFSLEAVPIFLAGMLFGPLPGAAGRVCGRFCRVSVLRLRV
ncbi:MAG: ECF transporter S component [Oscillospiraceae bacterium]